MKRVICVANQKGGVGKTTTTVNLGACLAVADQNVLLLDIDPQGNATTGLGLPKNQGDANIYTALMEGKITPSMIYDTAVDRLKAIPSTTDLYGAEIELVTVENRERRLLELIRQVEDDFDFVLIDCPPSLGMLTINALSASDSVVIPLQTEYYAMEGLSQLDKTIGRIRDAFNPGLKIEGILFTMVDGRTVLSQQVIKEVRGHYGDQVFITVIPRNIRLSEAPSHGKPIILYDFKSKGADAYIDFAHEIIQNHKQAERNSVSDNKDDVSGQSPQNGMYSQIGSER
ncbi:Chromosome (plasmid) partitioning protein ParA [hydrothermal vent metagenome]|uniref:Chromosome (Plasmid) partitioning protein ParA n=1 Tax=hydrothermal vent metagenome TaxID=652676 RepID=A0A3B1C3B3_9ZZZZ